MNKQLYPFLLLLFFSFSTKQSEAQNFSWVQQIAGTQYNLCHAATRDVNGDLLFTGWYEGTTDYDPGIDTFNLTPQNYNDGFVCKLNSSGNFIWAKTFGGSGSVSGIDIATDSAGNVFILGTFSQTADLDPDSGIYSVTSVGGNDFFILKLNQSGNFLWAKTFGNTTIDYPADIKIDTQGNAIITGRFSGTMDFDPNAGLHNVSATGTDIFLLNLDGAGNFNWVKTLPCSGEGIGIETVLDANGNYFLTGGFSATLDFDPGPAVSSVTAPPNQYLDFVLKLDPAGNFAWKKTFGGGNQCFPISMVLDNSGNFILTGTFTTTADFDPSAAIQNLIPHGASDIFVLKLDATGNFNWAKVMGGTANDQVEGLTTDMYGGIYITGGFEGQCNFEPAIPNTFYLSNGLQDIFICKLDSAGNTLNTITLGSSQDDDGVSIIADTAGNLFTFGNFNSTVDFNSGTAINTLTSVSDYDIFVLKLNDQTLGITKNTLGYKLISWPNPSTGVFTISKTFPDEADFEVTDIIGQQVLRGKFKSNNIQVDLSSLKDGVYLFRTNSGTIKLMKI